MRISFGFVLLVILSVIGLGAIFFFLILLLDFLRTTLAVLCEKIRLKMAEKIIYREIMKDKDVRNSYVITIEEMLECKNRQKVAKDIVDKIFNIWNEKI